MKLHMVAWILVVIGGLNWLLVGVGDFAGGNWNVVAWLCSFIGGTPVEAIVYILVGLAAIYEIVTHKSNCKACSTGASM
jgi:uncharacterized membrane protein YuzA (DUF378 family)